MTLSRRAKVGVGLVTVWPCLYFVLFASLVGGLFATAGRWEPLTEMPWWLTLASGLLVLAHLGTMLLMLALPVFYVYYIFRAENMPPDQQKILWVAGFVMCNCIAMPLFYYLYLWPERIGDASPHDVCEKDE